MNDRNFDKISKIISKHTKAKKEFINNETSSETIEGWDSLAHINIIVDIEKEFNIKIKTSKVEKLNSVKSITEFLTK
tara:strand:+ start:564 stop:794 length:231 start_codon:yes stop_codon:yes gene_type:complete